MSRNALRRLAPALALVATLAACGGSDPDTAASSPPATSTPAATTSATASPSPTETAEPTAAPSSEDAAFPVTISDDMGEVTLEAQPGAIVSLSPAATEILFAVGAGDQVIAADSLSNFPPEAPTDPDLSAFEPSAEAVLALEPDLVVTSFDANDLVAQLGEAGVPVVVQAAPPDLAGAYAQVRSLGELTGHAAQGDEVATGMEEDLAALAGSADGSGMTYYHELDQNLFTLTSSTLFGEVYDLFGLENVADPADEDGEAFGYPQLSSEFLVDADPDLVFLACTVFCEVTADSFGARDGFAQLTAVQEGNVVELDDDVASRWGPRLVELGDAVAKAVVDAG